MTYHLVTVVVIVSAAMVISRLVEVGQREAAPLGRILLHLHDAAVTRGAASSDHQQPSVRDSNTTALTGTCMQYITVQDGPKNFFFYMW